MLALSIVFVLDIIFYIFFIETIKKTRVTRIEPKLRPTTDELLKETIFTDLQIKVNHF